MHSALSALEAMGTQHSVPLTLQALSAECVHRVWSHVPVSPADLPGPLPRGTTLQHWFFTTLQYRFFRLKKPVFSVEKGFFG